METKFTEIKEEILRRAREAKACRPEYGRAYAADTMAELMQVIKDNFYWACDHEVLTVELIAKYRDEFAAHDIRANENVQSGYLLCDNATVKAWGNATVEAWGNATVKTCSNATVKARGNATVEAWGNATVKARGNATVEAWGNATVEAWDNATVEAWGSAAVKAWGNATVKAWGSAAVKAWDNATVEAWGSAAVKARDNAYCTSYNMIECKLSDHALYRVRSTNTVYFANDSIKFVKQPAEAATTDD